MEYCKINCQSWKSHREYSKAWNSQFTDGSIKSIDFERDVSDLKNVKNYPETNDNTTNGILEEIYLADTYMTDGEMETRCKANRTRKF